MNRCFAFITRCVFVLPILLVLPVLHSLSPSRALASLHAMPAHPAVLEKLRQEGHPLPVTAARLSRGIDAPQRMAAPPTGSFNLLVVMVDFVDNIGSAGSPAYIDNLVFATPGVGVNSVADYYDEISRSTLTLVKVTADAPSNLGWQRVPGSYNGPSGYVNANTTSPGGDYDDYGFGFFPQNLQGIVWNTIPLIDPVVDFSNYDNDGDGYVESVTFVHAGPGAEVTLNPSHIWSSAWNMSDNQGPGPIYTLEGVMVDNFSFEAEYMVSPGDQTIGMFCHELGHSLFGLPDLYDPDYTSNGVGMWSLMAAGAWNGNGAAYDGSSPAWPDAWSRTVMGFETPTEVTSNLTSQFIDPAETSINPATTVYRLWSPHLGPREYYLVENRQQVGYDVYLPGKGVLIWHVDEDKWNLWEANQYECTLFPQPGCSCPVWHYLVSLEQADGQYHLETTTTNFGDANDAYPWPYQQNPIPLPPNGNQNFEYTSIPESGSWYASPCASDSCVAVKNISLFLQGPPDLLMADFQVFCMSGSPCLNILQPPIEWIEGGGTANHLVSLQNCGGQDLFSFSASSEWPVSFYNPVNGQPITNMLIMGGGTAQVGVRVQVPESVGPGDGSLGTLLVTPNWVPGPPFTATLTTRIPTCVLLVDDDRSQPDVEPAYLTALLQNRFDLDYWDIETRGNPGANDLAAHEAAVWFTGAYPFDTLHIRDELALANYLDGGGQLFFSSQDYLNDAYRTFFNRTYLGVGMYLTDLGATTIQGVTGTPLFQNLGPYTLMVPAPGADRFNPLPGAMAAFQNENTYYNAMLSDMGTWRSLFLAWPFESLMPLDAGAVMTTTMDWLDIAPRPMVSFTASDSLVCTGEAVTFTNTTLGGTRWWWDFGDGSSSTMTDTVHTYYYPFTATVTLKGKNSCGYETTAQSIEVAQTPWVTFTVSSEAVLVGETVAFTTTGYGYTHLLWDFGDGMTSTLANPTHAYTAPLTATVVLQGFSDDCGIATAQRTIRSESSEVTLHRVHLPLAQKEASGARTPSGGDWALVALPAVVGIMVLGRKRR